MKKISLSVICFSITLLSFYTYFKTTKIYLPKPFGYVHIDLPHHEYVDLPNNWPFSFQISKYAKIEIPKDYEKDWLNIVYPNLDSKFVATIQLTYKYVNGNKTLLRSLLNDSYKLGMKHNVKAYSIDQEIIKTSQNKKIALFTIRGEVPTTFQFYTMDCDDHFIRGALYFKTALANDYLEPIINYIKTDIIHLLSTLEYKNK